MLKHHIEKNIIKDKSQLTDLFYSGCKESEKTGIEFEKLPVYSNTFKAVKYEDIARFMLQYKNGTWESLFDNRHLIGLENESAHITLEPGSQFEISLNPQKNIKEIKTALDDYNTATAELGDKLGITWLGYGIQPVSTYKNIKIIPKRRYDFMTEYLPNVAKKPLVMMRETSGIQVGMDYKSEEDAMKKLAVSLKLSPIVSAIYSNSPIRNGRLSKYKSFRALSWLNTDNDRCGLVSSKLFRQNNEFSFEQYAETLLDVPMIFIERPMENTSAISVNGLTFRQFLKDGFNGFSATIEDWELHLSLYFPEVRLKSYLEIRNHDNQKSELIPSVPAFWKGIIYNSDAIETVESIFKGFKYRDFQFIRNNAPRYGLDFKIRNTKIADLAKEFIKISYQSLKSMKTNEEKYLTPLMKYTNHNITPADKIIDLWENKWNADISKLVEYTRLA